MHNQAQWILLFGFILSGSALWGAPAFASTTASTTATSTTLVASSTKLSSSSTTSMVSSTATSSKQASSSPQLQSLRTSAATAPGSGGGAMGTSAPQSSVGSQFVASDLNENGIPDATEAEIVLTGAPTLAAGTYQFQTLRLAPGATLTLESDRDAGTGVTIHSDRLVLEEGAHLSADATGYNRLDANFGANPDYPRAGPSHGGVGQSRNAMNWYGSSRHPTTLGSGSGSRRGGGAVTLMISDQLVVEGLVSADGARTGSGGSVLVHAAQIEGDGGIRAAGGSYVYGMRLNYPGAGGRVAIHAEQYDFVGEVVAPGGTGVRNSVTGGTNDASPGTVAIFNTVTNTITVHEYYRFQTNDIPHQYQALIATDATIDIETGTTITISDIQLRGASSMQAATGTEVVSDTIYLRDESSLQVADTVVSPLRQLILDDQARIQMSAPYAQEFIADEIVIGPEAQIIADGTGYNKPYDQTYVPPPGTRYGASHGGVGSGNYASSTYGTSDAPVTLGSGSSLSRHGGGAIKIESDRLQLEGTISANAETSSSGGSIWIISKVLAGAGRVEAAGGDFTPSYNLNTGPGGGGRIAVYAEDLIDWHGSLAAPGGLAQSFSGQRNYAGEGSVVLVKTASEPEPSCSENCHSNVMFLPGIQASRLYMDGVLGTENQLWIPNRNKDARRLAFTEDGESIEDVYTRDVLDSVIGMGTVYQGLMDSLDDMVSDDLIQAWEPYAYDWRYGVDTVAKEGTAYETEVVNAIDRVKALASDSRTGKVILVGHSNGGLLAKAIAIELEKQGKAELLDTIVLLASPQLGTPKAIGSILHGFDQEIVYGLILSADTARTTMANLPGAYGLIPTDKYIVNTDRPVVRFTESSAIDMFTSVYGDDIDSASELYDFMTGTADNRPEPSNIYDASRANVAIAAAARNLHKDVLQPWRAASGTRVVEVAGTGLPTVDGFEYREYRRQDCAVLGLISCTIETYYKPVPTHSLNGDETVMLQSAVGFAANKDTYYLDLKEYREVGNFRHVNFTEAPAVQEALRHIITGVEVSVDFISTTKPSNRTNYSVIASHSPATLTLRDATGRSSSVATNQSGFKEKSAGIPNSYVYTLASTTYVVVPKDGEYDIEIQGTGTGGVTLEVDSLDGYGQTITHSVWMPNITADTSITSQLVAGTPKVVQVDYEGDGEVDKYINPDTNEEIVAISSGELIMVSESSSSYGTRIKPRTQVAGASTTAAAILHSEEEYLQQLSLLLTELENLIILYETHF